MRIIKKITPFLLILSLFAAWMYNYPPVPFLKNLGGQGWPRIWQNPAIPPEIKEAKASPDTLTLRPNAAGYYQEWTPFGDTVHWQLTSDQSDTTGVQVTGSTTLKETENLAGTEQTGTINSVTAYMRAKVTGETLVDDTITYDAVGSGNNAGGATTITWSHTVGTGLNRFMAIGISIRTTTVTVSSITVGSQNAVFIRGDNNATDVRGELWYLIAPNSGTQTITVTLSGSSKAAGGSVSYTNVRQTAPLDNHAFKIGTSATPNVDLTVNTANAMVFINNATKYDPTVSSHNSGQTHRYYQKTTGGLLPSSRNVGDGDDKLESTTGAKNYQITISDSRDWVVQAFSFKPSQFNPVEQATLIWKLGATEVEPGGVTISRTEFTNYSDTRTTNPGGGTWTWTDINNLEVGSRATALGAAETIQVSEYWIVVDYTPPIVSVSVSDGVVTYGIMPANTSKSTLPSELNDMQTATNDGNVTENFNIKGQDATGGGCTWTLAATNGSDQYVHQFCNDTDLDCSSPPTNYIALTTTYQALDTGIAVSGTVQIQLRLTTPNPSSCYGQQSVNVTIQAVQP